jgi:hypothetical protein
MSTTFKRIRAPKTALSTMETPARPSAKSCTSSENQVTGSFGIKGDEVMALEQIRSSRPAKAPFFRRRITAAPVTIKASRIAH